MLSIKLRLSGGILGGKESISKLAEELGTSKFHTWKDRYGKANEHNGKIPRDFWLEDWERQAILDDHDSHPLNGYRRLAFMLLDDDIVAVSPSTVYRVLRNAGRLDRDRWAPSK